MFSGCTSLTSVTSELRVTSATGSQSLGYVFGGCTSLQNGPVIYNCPSAPNQTYVSMFSGCTNLRNVTCLYANSNSQSVFYNWMKGVRNQDDCTFYASSDAISNNYWSRGYSGVPSNWVIAEYQPPV